MLTVLVHDGGQTRRADGVDPAWLAPGAPVTVWVDIEQPDAADQRLLSETFHFHELAIEDALSEIHHPKIESYDGFLYLILHGIVPGEDHRGFTTQDVDFFLGTNYLVTIHHSHSRSIADEQ